VYQPEVPEQQGLTGLVQRRRSELNEALFNALIVQQVLDEYKVIHNLTRPHRLQVDCLGGRRIAEGACCFRALLLLGRLHLLVGGGLQSQLRFLLTPILRFVRMKPSCLRMLQL